MCRDFFPKLEALVKKHPRIALGKVDIDNHRQVQGPYSVFTVPLVILTIEGKETLREARNTSLNLLEEKLIRYEKLLFDA